MAGLPAKTINGFHLLAGHSQADEDYANAHSINANASAASQNWGANNPSAEWATAHNQTWAPSLQAPNAQAAAANGPLNTDAEKKAAALAANPNPVTPGTNWHGLGGPLTPLAQTPTPAPATTWHGGQGGFGNLEAAPVKPLAATLGFDPNGQIAPYMAPPGINRDRLASTPDTSPYSEVGGVMGVILRADEAWTNKVRAAPGALGDLMNYTLGPNGIVTGKIDTSPVGSAISSIAGALNTSGQAAVSGVTAADYNLNVLLFGKDYVDKQRAISKHDQLAALADIKSGDLIGTTAATAGGNGGLQNLGGSTWYPTAEILRYREMPPSADKTALIADAAVTDAYGLTRGENYWGQKVPPMTREQAIKASGMYTSLDAAAVAALHPDALERLISMGYAVNPDGSMTLMTPGDLNPGSGDFWNTPPRKASGGGGGGGGGGYYGGGSTRSVDDMIQWKIRIE